MSFPAILIPDHLEVALVRGNSGLANKTKQIVDLNGGHIQSHHQMNGSGGIAKINDLGLMTLIGSSQGLILKGTTTETIDANKQKNTITNGMDGGGAMRLDTALIKALGANIGSAMPLIAAIKEMQARGQFFITPAEMRPNTPHNIEAQNNSTIINMTKIFETLAEIINLNAVTPLPAAMESHQQSIATLISELMEIIQAEIPQMNDIMQAVMMASVQSIAPIAASIDNSELIKTLEIMLDAVTNSPVITTAEPQLKPDAPTHHSGNNSIDIIPVDIKAEIKIEPQKAEAETESVDTNLTKTDGETPSSNPEISAAIVDIKSAAAITGPAETTVQKTNPTVTKTEITTESISKITQAEFYKPPLPATQISLPAATMANTPIAHNDAKPAIETKFKPYIAATIVTPQATKSFVQNAMVSNIIGTIMPKNSAPLSNAANILPSPLKINMPRTMDMPAKIPPILSPSTLALKPHIAIALKTPIVQNPVTQNRIIPPVSQPLNHLKTALPAAPAVVAKAVSAQPASLPQAKTNTSLPPIISKMISPIIQRVPDNFVKAVETVSAIFKPHVPTIVTPDSPPQKIPTLRQSIIDIFKQPPERPTERPKENIITTVQDFYKKITQNPDVIRACPKGGAVCNCFNKVSKALSDNKFLEELAGKKISVETFKKDVEDQRNLAEQLDRLIPKPDPKETEGALLLKALAVAKPPAPQTGIKPSDLKDNFGHVCGPNCNHEPPSTLTRADTRAPETTQGKPLTAKQIRELAAAQNKALNI